MSKSDFIQKVKKRDNRLIKAQAEFFYDYPEKIVTNEEDDTHHISKKIASEVDNIEKNALIISPYFILTKAMLTTFSKLRKKIYGVIYKTTENGQEVIYYKLPYAGFMKILGANIMSLFPIDGYL